MFAPENRPRAPLGSQIVFQAIIFRMLLLLVPGRVTAKTPEGWMVGRRDDVSFVSFLGGLFPAYFQGQTCCSLLGIQSLFENGSMEPKYYAEELIGHPNHHLI